MFPWGADETNQATVTLQTESRFFRIQNSGGVCFGTKDSLSLPCCPGPPSVQEVQEAPVNMSSRGLTGMELDVLSQYKLIIQTDYCASRPNKNLQLAPVAHFPPVARLDLVHPAE